MIKLSTTALCFSIFALDGCAGSMDSMKHATHPGMIYQDDVKAMEAANDWDKVSVTCGHGGDPKIQQDAQALACRDLSAHFATLVTNASCADKPKAFADAKRPFDVTYRGHPSPERDAMAKSILDCKDADYYVLNGPSDEILHLYRDQNVSFLPSILHVVETPEIASTLKFGSARFFLAYIDEVSKKSDATPPCDEVVKGFANANTQAIAGAAGYFSKNKCTSAAPLLESALMDGDARKRTDVCNALGEVGSGTSMDKVNIIAASDAAFETDGLVKTYFVRDACRQAAGKIAFRSGKAPAATSAKKAKNQK